jgi:hypothetical protein
MLDHKDNNPSNNDASNLQILCRAHNTFKNPRGPGKRGVRMRHILDSLTRTRVRESEKDREIETILGDRTASPLIRHAEMKKNIECEPKFRTWVEGMIRRHGRMKAVVLAEGGAEEVGCSQQTTRRYLDKMCSIAGILRYDKTEEGTFVELKPEYIAGDTAAS